MEDLGRQFLYLVTALQVIIFDRYSFFSLNPEEYVILGSGVMFALGIRPLSELDDIDILVSVSGWKKVRGLAEVKHDEKKDLRHIRMIEEHL